MDLLLATRNLHKVREFRELLGAEFNVLDLPSFSEITFAKETGRSARTGDALCSQAPRRIVVDIATRTRGKATEQ